MATTKEEDYTRYRTVGVIPYAIDDKIGRRDSRDRTAVTDVTLVSGIYTLLPAAPLGRRDYISIKNTGAVSVLITTESGATTGVPLAAGAEFSDSTDATFYAYSTAPGSVNVYERSTR